MYVCLHRVFVSAIFLVTAHCSIPFPVNAISLTLFHSIGRAWRWVIRICRWKKDRQHNGQKKKDKWTNDDLQTLHIKLKIEDHEPRMWTHVLRKGSSSCFTSGTRRVTLVTKPVISHECLFWVEASIWSFELKFFFHRLFTSVLTLEIQYWSAILKTWNPTCHMYNNIQT